MTECIVAVRIFTAASPFWNTVYVWTCVIIYAASNVWQSVDFLFVFRCTKWCWFIL